MIPSYHNSPHTHYTGQGVKQRLKQAFGISDKGPVMDLKTEFRKLMLSPDKRPVIVSEDPAKLTMLMATLTNYEKQVLALTTVYSVHVFNTLKIVFEECKVLK